MTGSRAGSYLPLRVASITVIDPKSPKPVMSAKSAMKLRKAQDKAGQGKKVSKKAPPAWLGGARDEDKNFGGKKFRQRNDEAAAKLKAKQKAERDAKIVKAEDVNKDYAKAADERRAAQDKLLKEHMAAAKKAQAEAQSEDGPTDGADSAASTSASDKARLDKQAPAKRSDGERRG